MGSGETWNTGGFTAARLRAVHQIVSERFDRPVRILETGAGNSTITFLHLPVEQLVTIAPSPELRDRILDYCSRHGIDTSALDFRVERSEIALPVIAFGTENERAETPGRAPQFDVVLIDGGHGWPTVFVDFCYANAMMPSGSLLFLDDTQLHSVAELGRLLEMQPGFTLRQELSKLQVWEKHTDQRFLPGHAQEPYIIEKSKASNVDRLRALAPRLARLRRGGAQAVPAT